MKKNNRSLSVKNKKYISMEQYWDLRDKNKLKFLGHFYNDECKDWEDKYSVAGKEVTLKPKYAKMIRNQVGFYYFEGNEEESYSSVVPAGFGYYYNKRAGHSVERFYNHKGESVKYYSVKDCTGFITDGDKNLCVVDNVVIGGLEELRHKMKKSSYKVLNELEEDFINIEGLTKAKKDKNYISTYIDTLVQMYQCDKKDIIDALEKGLIEVDDIRCYIAFKRIKDLKDLYTFYNNSFCKWEKNNEEIPFTAVINFLLDIGKKSEIDNLRLGFEGARELMGKMVLE